MNQFCVPDRLKAIKKTSSGLIGSFNIKKNRNLFDSSFFYKNFLFFFAFYIEFPLMTNLLYSRMKPTEQKKLFSRNCSCFFCFDSEFS